MRYSTLREDVKSVMNDPGFDRLIPMASYVKLYPHLVIPLAVGWSLAILLYLLSNNSTITPMGVIGMVVFTFFFILQSDSLFTSSIQKIKDSADVLLHYIEDYVDSDPVLSRQIRRQPDLEFETRIENLEEENNNLCKELGRDKQELATLREQIAGLTMPSSYKVPQQVLEKLEPIEKKRLLEAVQAYRVNAWTPAAAVCGMILEGRLQRLCQKNNLSIGGIGQMIRQLGEAGLLKGYYQNLLQVGEFFRHRASHPTSEDFDRDKTTLILAALLILIRELF
jgi:hypothetical protein